MFLIKQSQFTLPDFLLEGVGYGLSQKNRPRVSAKSRGRLLLAMGR